MPTPSNESSDSIISPVSRMSFAVALCAFAAAGVGWIVNNWLSGWMAVGGMFGVGLFYLAVGVLNLNLHPIKSKDQPLDSLSHQTANADNLVGEPIKRPELHVPDEASRDNSEQPSAS